MKYGAAHAQTREQAALVVCAISSLLFCKINDEGYNEKIFEDNSVRLRGIMYDILFFYP